MSTPGAVSTTKVTEELDRMIQRLNPSDPAVVRDLIDIVRKVNLAVQKLADGR